jgi:hypothetical protein
MQRARHLGPAGTEPDAERRRRVAPGKVTLTQKLGRSGVSQEQAPGQTAAMGDAGPDAKIGDQPAIGDGTWELIGDEPAHAADGGVATTQAAPAGAVAASTEDAAPASPWTGGPSPGVARKSTSVPLADYVLWLRDVERAYGSSPETIQRLRRLYYSEGSGSAGSKFDLLLDTAADTRLTAPPLAQPVLDRLFETDTIVTSSGVSDPSHIFALLDLEQNGKSAAGSLANAGASLGGVLTWTGDLASWFVEWYAQHRDLLASRDGGIAEEEWIPVADQLAHLEQVRASKVSKEDLIGDMDAHAIEPDEVGRPPGQGSIASAFERYFANDAQRRFHLFMQSVEPPIPHKVVGHNPVKVALDSATERAIYDRLWCAVMVLRVDPFDPLDGYTHILEYIAHAFAEFLRTGLATGDAPW